MPDDRLDQIRRGYAADGYLADEPPDLSTLRALAECEEQSDVVSRPQALVSTRGQRG